MYINYGDVDFFEHGVLVDADHLENEFDILRCEPYPDEEDLYVFAHLHVNIDDSWLDRANVMEYAGMKEFDPVMYSIACTDYYSWENFGASDYGVFYDWRRMTKKDIQKELRKYHISSEGLNDLF